MTYQRYRRYATSGERMVWTEGDDRPNRSELVTLLSNLDLKSDIVVWWSYTEARVAIVMTLIYSPFGYKVKNYPYGDLTITEDMSEEDAANFWAPPDPDDLARYE